MASFATHYNYSVSDALNRGIAPLRNTLPVIPNVPATKNATSLNALIGPAPVSNAPMNRLLCMMAAVGGFLMFSYVFNASLTVLCSHPTFANSFATHSASCIA